MPEAGVVWPGMILVATDSHTTTHGAFGAFGTGVGATDLATIMMSGELWFRVPEIINIVIEGTLPAGVFAKDVILHIIGALKADVAVYKAVEFSGTYVDALSVADRMTICNMAVEMGAKTAYMKPNETVLNYVKARTAQAFTLDETDADFMYNAVYHFDISALKPQVAMPHSVDNVCDLEAIAGPKAERIKVDQAFIGSCTGGRLEDIAAAYHVLKDAKVNANTRLVIIPASAEVYQNAIEMGYVTALIDAGATFAAPGCGPCLGTHAGLIAAGEVCMSATNRNFPGRMGSTEGRIYLASPASVAASARNGFISDPSEFWIRRPKHA
jgi:3-isopropylmalate/(R)-2-methylmalate dehydratase large subunit